MLKSRGGGGEGGGYLTPIWMIISFGTLLIHDKPQQTQCLLSSGVYLFKDRNAAPLCERPTDSYLTFATYLIAFITTLSVLISMI